MLITTYKRRQLIIESCESIWGSLIQFLRSGEIRFAVVHSKVLSIAGNVDELLRSPVCLVGRMRMIQGVYNIEKKTLCTRILLWDNTFRYITIL